ncbi:MAG TPA: acyl-CoA dehydrogenase family protein [Acidimicrobiales bacterium]|nr:acyl-CoA dehydrogenase family protein [Acidimicrobiales bacterium]
MRFAFTDEQVLLRDTVRSLLERECPPSVVRAAWTDTSAADRPWKLLEEVGVFDPSLTDLDLVSVFEETGRAALPGPFVETVVGAETVGVEATLVDHSVRWRSVGANDRAVVGTAAQLVGLAARMIAMTVDYAKDRTQFGVPIGRYQAIKHHLANAHLKVEYTRPVVYRAAYALAHDEADRARDASFAKVYANEAAAVAAKVALQCHGAIGYSFEYDLHLWMKRAWVLQTAWGGTAFHRNRVAAAVVG